MNWTYDSELGLRLWGGLASVGMADIRENLRKESIAMQAASWNGSLDSEKLAMAVLGGFEASYGVAPELKLVGSIDLRGVWVTGVFEGYGVNSTYDPILGLVSQEVTRISRFSAWGGEAGIVYFLRYIGNFSRLGLEVKAGPHSLTGSQDSYEETGLLRSGLSKLKYSGSAAGFFTGLLWEWMVPEPSSSLPFSGFFSAGYRFLKFASVKYSYTDSNGVYSTGTLRDADGRDMAVDFSGPEITIGFSLLFPVQPPR